MENCCPTASNFCYHFLAKNGLPRGSELGPKITTEIWCCGAIFSHRHDLGALDPTQKSIFRDRLPEVVGDSDLQMLNSVKLDFFRYPVWWWLIHKLVWNFETMPCSFMFHLARYNKSRWKSILLKYLWATHFSRQNTRGEVAWIRFRPLTFDWGALATWKSVPSLHFLIF